MGRAWVRGRLQPVEIGLDDEGRIVRLARNVPGGRRIDLADQVILPSATDLHVHLREPGGPEAAEGFSSGTEAAALGGIATVGDMPNTEPPLTSVADVEEKVARARGRLAVDVVVYGEVTTPARVAALARVVGAFKLFLSPTTGTADPPARSSIPALLDAVARTGLALTVHAEEPGAFRSGAPPGTVAAWDEARPAAAERAAVDRLLPPPAALRLHVAHVTTQATADRLRTAGQSFEVAPHHLLLASDATTDPRRKVNPPLRREAERAALWEEFRLGRIPHVASDHAPHSVAAKARPFADAPSGMPGVETMLPLLLERVRSGELALETLLRAACDRPARWFGLPQGRLEVGLRARLLVVDFRTRRPIRASALRTACGWSAFEGWPAVFPTRHYLDGELIVEEGAYVGRRIGKIVRPEYARRGRPTDGAEPG